MRTQRGGGRAQDVALILAALLALACAGCAPERATPAEDARETASAPAADAAEGPQAAPDGVDGAPNPVALVYNGEVAAEGAPEALAEVAESINLSVVYFHDPADLPELLDGAAFCMVPGTEDDLDPLLEAFTPEAREALAVWLESGGAYVGICGGAYIASEGWEDVGGWVEALGISPVETEAWVEEDDPRIITITWDGRARPIYYQYGPVFLVEDSSDGEVLARYDDGGAAGLVTEIGDGRVVVFGPHPEADETWLSDDPDPLDADRWAPTRDIAQAVLLAGMGE